MFEFPLLFCPVTLLNPKQTVAYALIQKIGSVRCGPNGLSYGTSHKDWVFEESRRR